MSSPLVVVDFSRMWTDGLGSLAIRYQFETTQLVEGPTYLNSQSPPPPLTMSFNPKERRNPYLLTWSLRGIVEDAQVRELFGDELTALREAFEVSFYSLCFGFCRVADFCGTDLETDYEGVEGGEAEARGGSDAASGKEGRREVVDISLF